MTNIIATAKKEITIKNIVLNSQNKEIIDLGTNTYINNIKTSSDFRRHLCLKKLKETKLSLN